MTKLPSVAIRAASPADAAALAELEELTLSDPWSVELVAGSLADGATSAWIAESEGVALGFALFRHAADEVELLRLGVDPAWRRAGVGGELVARGLAFALDGGASACFLEVRAGNLPARRLYERLGFALVGTRAAYYSDGDDAFVYRRSLAGG